MIKHIFKIIWAQRRTNGWIFGELLVVVCAVWWMTDKLFVDLKTYNTPLGYDVTNCWNLKMKKIAADSPQYTPDSLLPTTMGEDMMQLIRQLRTNPAIADVGVSFGISLPYQGGAFRSNVQPVDGDTTNLHEQFFIIKYVYPEFFDVFRIKDIHGQPITASLAGVTDNDVVVTADMAELFFHETNVKGRYVGFGGEYVMPILAVTTPIRKNEFEKGDPFYYQFIMSDVERLLTKYGPNFFDVSIRTKQYLSLEDMDRLLEEMGPRLQVNNIKIYTATSFEEMRTDSLKKPTDLLSRNIAFMVFLLINIFFGVIGTFWLKTQHRQGELGLRVALGASRWNLKEYIYIEGLLILLLTVPFTLVFALNMMFLDVLDTYRQPLTLLRFFVTYGGSYLLMIGMICIGIWFPVHKTSKMAPAEALHYE